MRHLNPRLRFIPLALVAVIGLHLLMPGAGAATVSARDAMLRATNTSRLNHEVRRVRIQDAISKLAREHSLAMATSGALFHTEDPARTYLRGIDWTTWVTPGTIADLQAAFMRSPGHRANILNKAFRHVAIGAVRRDGVLWVTVFFWA
jgi:uncharacterized protein YkwD